MATAMENFPLSTLSDGIISYIQYLFGSPQHTPSEYRWNKNDRESRITISGPFIIDNERPESSPYITVERGAFGIDDRVIDNTRSADENVFTNEMSMLIANGSIIITVGTSVATEASNIANFLLIQLQADRHGIISTLGFMRNLKSLEISPETPVFNAAEIRRWNVTLTINTSLQMGWKKTEEEGDLWEQYELRAINKPASYESSNGVITSGSDLIVDHSANFGYEVTNEPQLLRSEFDKGWYYVMIGGVLYNVVEVVDTNTLRLSKDDLPYSPDNSGASTNYSLLWNDVHLHVKI